MSDLIKVIRKNVAEMGGSEVKGLATSSGLRQLWSYKQQLIEEMNAAKKSAAEEAAKPYLELIADIEEQYAFYLQMIGDNGED